MIEISDNVQTSNSNLLGGDENVGYTLEYRNDTMDVRGRTNSIDSIDSVSVNSENLGITSVLNAEDLDSENSTDRQLVVVSVRGSVTPLDWLMDILTQFHVKKLDFEAGSEMVLESLYGYDDYAENVFSVHIPQAILASQLKRPVPNSVRGVDWCLQTWK